MPLYAAARYGQREVVEVLLKHEPYLLGVGSNDHESALEAAIRQNHTQIAKCLIQRGAPLKLRNNNNPYIWQ